MGLSGDFLEWAMARRLLAEEPGAIPSGCDKQGIHRRAEFLNEE
jgi:hypothetical protein